MTDLQGLSAPFFNELAWGDAFTGFNFILLMFHVISLFLTAHLNNGLFYWKDYERTMAIFYHDLAVGFDSRPARRWSKIHQAD